jgi:hypothetical protein
MYAHVPVLFKGYAKLEQATAKLHRLEQAASPHRAESRHPHTLRILRRHGLRDLSSVGSDRRGIPGPPPIAHSRSERQKAMDAADGAFDVVAGSLDELRDSGASGSRRREGARPDGGPGTSR